MVLVVSEFTNAYENGGSHSNPAKYKAKKVSASELQSMVTSETIVVDTHEIADRLIKKFHYERDMKNNKISLASALELVQKESEEKQKEELEQYEPMETKLAQLQKQREAQEARLEAEAEKEWLDSKLKERALLRVNLLSEIMPTLM